MSTRSETQDASQGPQAQELVQALALERVAYTMPEAAALLGVSERYLWKLAEQGIVPLVRLGGRTLVRKAALERALLEREARHEGAGQLRVMK